MKGCSIEVANNWWNAVMSTDIKITHPLLLMVSILWNPSCDDDGSQISVVHDLIMNYDNLHFNYFPTVSDFAR